MTIYSFMGGAGCGKTYSLMQKLSSDLNTSPLADRESVLALTFMHGSRQRLQSKLHSITAIRGKFSCLTIDSFAWRIVNRWRSLASDIGINNIIESDFETVCNTAELLLSFDFVGSWVSSRYKLAVIDEAQDLNTTRTNILKKLSNYIDIYIAADEFQCLDQNIRPNPSCDWIKSFSTLTELSLPRRTNDASLLEAAKSIRNGQAPKEGKSIKIRTTPTAPLTASWASNEIGWYGRGGSIAIITPSMNSFTAGVVRWMENRTTSKNNGPHVIKQEISESKLSDQILTGLGLPETLPHVDALKAIKTTNDMELIADIEPWLHKQKRCLGRESVRKEDLERAISRSLSGRKKHRVIKECGISMMTIHGAKNREFDNVIVIWPVALTASDDQKRRLLYNAITRAKRRCLILIQNKRSAESPPFI